MGRTKGARGKKKRTRAKTVTPTAVAERRRAAAEAKEKEQREAHGGGLQAFFLQISTADVSQNPISSGCCDSSSSGKCVAHKRIEVSRKYNHSKHVG